MERNDTEIFKFPEGFDVKPCPFCGSTDVVAESYVHAAGMRWRVFCLACMGEMNKGYSQTPWQALDEWNRRESGWIRVADRLPEDGEEVLLYWKDAQTGKTYMEIDHYEKDGRWSSISNLNKTVPVAWMLLPNRPENVREGEEK